MRLIDADAEIKKIEEEIKRSYKAIDRWRSGRMPGSSLYDIDAKVRQIKNNIADCKREIRMLKSYTTAYNPEKVAEEMRDHAVEFELYGTCSHYVEINHAIEVIKRGGIVEQPRI